MLTAPDFINALAGLIECLPHHKALSERGLAFAWSSLPPQAKADLSPPLLAYATTQRLLDPEPRQQLAIHIQLLAYLYPLHNGVPFVQQGLRPDLQRRIQQPGVFHPLITHPEHQRALPPAADVPLPQESREQRRRRIQSLAEATLQVALMEVEP
jgi:hypothetical protein